MITFKIKQVDNYRFNFLESSFDLLQFRIYGKIINSVVDSNKKQELLE